MSAKVAVVRCPSYDNSVVREALERAFEILNLGPEEFRTSGPVLLKPNMLLAFKPERAATTHPSVFAAAASLIRDSGAQVSFGDSPGYGSPRAVAAKTGMLAAAEHLDIPLADFERFVSMPSVLYPEPAAYPIARAAVDAGFIVGLPKLKTHQLTRMTGAVKNQFGCLVGFEKARSHLTHPHGIDFCKLLVDVCLIARPRLCIMDAVDAMEGEGPSAGRPRRLGLILVSTDPVALDAAASTILGLDPAYVGTTGVGQRFGLGSFDGMTMVGDEVPVISPPFDVERSPMRADSSLKLLRPLKGILLPRPEIDPRRCARCGVCVDACPVPAKAVRFRNEDRSKPPAYDYATCIRCYCCQELCPHSAITVRRSFLSRVFGS